MTPQEMYPSQLNHIRGGLFGSVQGRRCTRSLLPAALYSLVVLLALTARVSAQSALADDAHTNSAPRSVDANFGANPNLTVSSTGNVYIKFKLSSTLPAGTPGSAVEKATLKLYLGNVTAAGKLDVYAVGGPWDEGAVTARNAPPLSTLLATTAQIGLDRRHKFLVIDVTTLVRQWLGEDGHGTNGLPNHGLALVAHPVDAETPEVANITFDSKENSQTSHEPQLIVHLQSSAGALQKVEHDATLQGDGTTSSPLGVASGGINASHLADGTVTGAKIADGSVTSSELADGSVTSAKVAAPLSLTSADPNFTLSAANTGAGAAITAAGAINTTTQYNIGGQRVLSNAGTDNLFAGAGAGAANTGSGNSFFGQNVGQANTTGFNNSFFGINTGRNNLTGAGNAFFGQHAGFNNTTGSSNAFFGHSVGASNTTGRLNSFFGTQAGLNNTTGEENSFFGWNAGSGNSTGTNLTLLGAKTRVGFGPLHYAAAIGADAVVATSDTIVLGKEAGTYNGLPRPADTVRIPGTLVVVGSPSSFGGTVSSTVFDASTHYNIAGNRVLSMAGSFNLIAGASAGASITSGNSNAFFGRAAGNQTTTGSANSFFGRDAGLSNVGGSANSFFGFEAGKVNTVGFNSFFGHQAGLSNTVASRNSFFGALAGLNTTTGGSNSFFGIEAGKLNTEGEFNSFFGDGAGVSNTTADGNSFFGFHAGLFNTTGADNNFFGKSAGLNNTTGALNSFFGSATGSRNTTGNGNTFFGVLADFDSPGADGENNTLLGVSTRVGASLTNATAIGALARVTQSNSLVLGSISGVNGASSSTSVGVGTTAPKARLHVTGGKVYVEANGQGVVLKSPAGACFELTVTDAGTLSVEAMAACP